MRKSLILLILGTNFLFVYSQKTLVESGNEFAFNIYRSTKPDMDNHFISPFGLYVALSVVNEGAHADTREEIDKLLCLEPAAERSDRYFDLIEKTLDLRDYAMGDDCIEESYEVNAANELFLANSIWHDKGISLKETFREDVQTKYYTEIFDFKGKELDQANMRLKKWVSAKTKNKIEDMSELGPDNKLSLFNTIYFKGVWDVPFDEEETEEGIFTAIDGEKVKKEFMRKYEDLIYYEDTYMQLVVIPYKCFQFLMIVLLPREDYGLLKLEKNLNTDLIKIIKHSAYNYKVDLSLPKFKIESELSPRDAIISMGYPGMFNDRADFSAMASGRNIKIDNITQKTVIDVNEKSTEAAAVTQVDLLYIGQPQEVKFTADRPFMFLIADNRTEAILFMGRYVK